MVINPQPKGYAPYSKKFSRKDCTKKHKNHERKSLTSCISITKNSGPLCFLLITSGLVEAKTITLTTPGLLFNSYKTIDIDEFEYTYRTAHINQKKQTFTLKDGSVWQVTPMRDETASFYEKKEKPISIEKILHSWQPNDEIIFHNSSSYLTILAYNVTRGLLLNAVPIKSPDNPQLLISAVDKQVIPAGNNHYWRSLITLSDDSIYFQEVSWSSYDFALRWHVGDPIIVVKDGQTTHKLINLRYIDHKYEELCVKEKELLVKHNLLGVEESLYVEKIR